jgi:hypothetical protein
LKDALVRFLQEYPSTGSGLSQSQAQALESVQNGETVLSQVYLSSHHARERYIFLGDIVFAAYLQSLSQCAEPLILFENGDQILAPRWNEDAAQFWERRLTLTAFGQAVLNGEGDQISRNGIDRWLGGVHLQGKGPLWRWDPNAHRLTIQ